MPVETRQILKLWRAASAAGEECALATVVRVEGSSYRKPGARMLITRAGRRAGTVSGGCLEAEVARKIWWLARSGPHVQDYTTSFDEDTLPSYGLGCNGTVTLLLERASGAADVFAALGGSIEERRSSAIATVIGTDHPDVPLGARLVVADSLANQPTGIDARRSPEDLRRQLLDFAQETLRTKESSASAVLFQGRELNVFSEYIAPPPALFVFGAGDDAQPVVHLAHSMGWDVAVADGRSNLATTARFPWADRIAVLDVAVPDVEDPLRNLRIGPDDAAVILTHSYKQDVAILRSLLPRHLAYLGVLGPRRRTERIVDEVATSIGLDAEQAMRRIKSPVGLDLGAGSPQVIALSMIAEIQAVLGRRTAAPLHLAGARRPVVVHG